MAISFVTSLREASRLEEKSGFAFGVYLNEKFLPGSADEKICAFRANPFWKRRDFGAVPHVPQFNVGEERFHLKSKIFLKWVSPIRPSAF